MALFNRHLGLSVAAVAVVSAIVMLGLQARCRPPPAISSFRRYRSRDVARCRG